MIKQSKARKEVNDEIKIEYSLGN